jgi:hypothetical protein
MLRSGFEQDMSPQVVSDTDRSRSVRVTGDSDNGAKISNDKRYDPIGSAPAREARVLSVMPDAGALSIGAFERMPEDGLLCDLNCSCLEIGQLRGTCRLGIR